MTGADAALVVVKCTTISVMALGCCSRCVLLNVIFLERAQEDMKTQAIQVSIVQILHFRGCEHEKMRKSHFFLDSLIILIVEGSLMKLWGL